MEFVRRPGFQLKAKPQIVGEVCHELEKNGKLTPKDLVEASRDVNAPLHNDFEWRDGVAAERYREFQAGYIIRSVAVKITQLPQEVTKVSLKFTECQDSVRYYHAVELDGNGYDSMETVSNDDEKRGKLMQLCIRDIKAFKEKYALLRFVLPDLFRVLDEITAGKVG